MSISDPKPRLGELLGSLYRQEGVAESMLPLLAANLLIIVIAVAAGWRAADVLWIYWGQSVVIGVFNVVRMWNLRRFSTDGLKQNNKPVPETEAGKRGAAIFFFFHYGFFHLIYALFLGSMTNGEGSPFEPMVLLCIGLFVLTHGYSWLRTREADEAGKPNLGAVMFLPYARILPMHFTIIFGGLLMGNSTLLLILFLLLKTAADCLMHLVEHAWLRKQASAEEQGAMVD